MMTEFKVCFRLQISCCVFKRRRLKSSYVENDAKFSTFLQGVTDCLISVKFYTGFGHVRPEIPHMFMVKGSKVKVIA